MFFASCGHMRPPGWVLRRGGGWGRASIPVVFAGVRRGDGRWVLVDTGFSRHELEHPVEAFGRLRATLFHVYDVAPALDQLRAAGIEPGEVAAIVPTHLHLDHIGGFTDFPNAEILVTSAEIEGAASGSRLGYIHLAALRRSGRLRPIELDSGERFGFPAHLDLFGDGRIVLLDARGHTAGSVAVLLTDPEAKSDGLATALMAGDAAYAPAEYREGRESFLMKLAGFRDAWIRETWGRLVAFERSHLETPIVLAHDLDGLARLPGPQAALGSSSKSSSAGDS